MGDFDGADLLHALLAFLLLLEELALTRDVAAVALGCHVLAHGLDGLPGYDFGSDGRLDGYVKLLARYQFLEFFAHAASESHGIVGMRESRQGIYTLAVEEDVELDQT